MAVKNQRGHTAATVKHFIDYPNQHVTAEELQGIIGGTRTQVQMAVNYVMKNGKLPGLRTVVNGDIWVYEPPTKEKDHESMHIIGHASDDGMVILQDSDGDLWAAKKVKF
jgi:hypothetical protein